MQFSIFFIVCCIISHIIFNLLGYICLTRIFYFYLYIFVTLFSIFNILQINIFIFICNFRYKFPFYKNVWHEFYAAYIKFFIYSKYKVRINIRRDFIWKYSMTNYLLSCWFFFLFLLFESEWNFICTIFCFFPYFILSRSDFYQYHYKFIRLYQYEGYACVHLS